MGARAVVRGGVTHDSDPVFGRNGVVFPCFGVALLTEHSPDLNVRIDRRSVRVFGNDQNLERKPRLQTV